MHIKN
jgi:intraflagellar transport protein 74